MNPLLNQRAMPLFSFDRVVTFVRYIFLLTLQMTIVSSQTEVMAYGHSGAYCKYISPSWEDSRPAWSMSSVSLYSHQRRTFRVQYFPSSGLPSSLVLQHWGPIKGWTKCITKSLSVSSGYIAMDYTDNDDPYSYVQWEERTEKMPSQIRAGQYNQKSISLQFYIFTTVMIN